MTQFASVSAPASLVPTIPSRPDFLRRREVRPGASLRTKAKQTLLTTMEHLPGFCPLDTHVVICGFPRSGSTLLLLIAEACYRKARTFHREKSGLNAAKDLKRSHPLMITKRPEDLFFVEEMRRFYEPMHTDLRIILTMRDPRAILTSRYSGRALPNTFNRPDGYVMTPEFWRAWSHHLSYVRQGKDAMLVEFADLVARPLWVQQQISSFIGWEPDLPFDQFTSAVPDGFETKALNGLRSFDAASVDRWRNPKYRDRIRQLLQEIPELPDGLIELGYEKDRSWVRDYD